MAMTDQEAIASAVKLFNKEGDEHKALKHLDVLLRINSSQYILREWHYSWLARQRDEEEFAKFEDVLPLYAADMLNRFGRIPDRTPAA